MLLADATLNRDTGLWSCGVAIIARDCVGLGWIGEIPCTREGRAIVAKLEIPNFPPIAAASLYCKDGVGLSQYNC